MGDAADDLTDQGWEAWWRHEAGDCGGDYCQYCDEKEAQREKWRAQKAKQRRKQRKQRSA